MYTNILFPPPHNAFQHETVYEAPTVKLILMSFSIPFPALSFDMFPDGFLKSQEKKHNLTKESDKMVTPPQKETSLPTGAKMVVSGRVPHKNQFYMNFTWNIPLLEIWLCFFHGFSPI